MHYTKLSITFLVLLGAAFWNDAVDGHVVRTALNELLSWSTSTASDRGKLVRFIYPNYAAVTQDIFAGFGSENTAQMKKVQNQYDPQLLLSKYWQGGFRL